MWGKIRWGWWTTPTLILISNSKSWKVTEKVFYKINIRARKRTNKKYISIMDQKLWGILKRQKVNGIILKKGTISQIHTEKDFCKRWMQPTRCLKPQRWWVRSRKGIWGDRQGDWLGTKGAAGGADPPLSPPCCFCQLGEGVSWVPEPKSQGSDLNVWKHPRGAGKLLTQENNEE